MNKFLLNFFRLTRPLSNVKNIAIVSLAFYLSGLKLNSALFVLGALSLSFIFSATYAYNTLCDINTDKKNENKKHYLKAVQYFGEKKSLLISAVLCGLGLVFGYFVNIYFFITLFFLLLVGFLYSSEYTRFKERVLLDVLFGASLTFLLRFVASWFIFEISFPPLLPMFALVFLKNGGYMLYKGYDRPHLIKSKIKNSITALPEKTTLIISACFFVASIVLFILMCLNSIYLRLGILGYLSIDFLALLILFIPPIIVQYLLFLNKIKIKPRYVRAAGLISLLLVIIIVLIIQR